MYRPAVLLLFCCLVSANALTDIKQFGWQEIDYFIRGRLMKNYISLMSHLACLFTPSASICNSYMAQAIITLNFAIHSMMGHFEPRNESYLTPNKFNESLYNNITNYQRKSNYSSTIKILLLNDFHLDFKYEQVCYSTE